MKTTLRKLQKLFPHSVIEIYPLKYDCTIGNVDEMLLWEDEDGKRFMEKQVIEVSHFTAVDSTIVAYVK